MKVIPDLSVCRQGLLVTVGKVGELYERYAFVSTNSNKLFQIVKLQILKKSLSGKVKLILSSTLFVLLFFKDIDLETHKPTDCLYLL